MRYSLKYVEVTGVDTSKLEDELIDLFEEAMNYKPMERAKLLKKELYDLVFKNFCDLLDASGAKTIVITNINPYRKMFSEDKSRLYLDIIRENLPFCGDGVIISSNSALNYFFPNGKVRADYLPSPFASIAMLGNKSPALSLASIRDVTNYKKSYGDSHHFDENGQSLDDLYETAIREKGFSYENYPIWGESFVSLWNSINGLMEKNGLAKAITDGTPLSEDMQHDLEIIQGLLKNARTRSLAVSALIGNQFSTIHELANGMMDLALRFSHASLNEPYMLSEFLHAMTEYFMADRDIFGDAIAKRVAEIELEGKIRPSHAQKIYRLIKDERLLKIMKAKARRETLDQDLGL